MADDSTDQPLDQINQQTLELQAAARAARQQNRGSPNRGRGRGSPARGRARGRGQGRGAAATAPAQPQTAGQPAVPPIFAPTDPALIAILQQNTQMMQQLQDQNAQLRLQVQENASRAIHRDEEYKSNRKLKQLLEVLKTAQKLGSSGFSRADEPKSTCRS